MGEILSVFAHDVCTGRNRLLRFDICCRIKVAWVNHSVACRITENWDRIT